MKSVRSIWAIPFPKESVRRPLAHVALRDNGERFRISNALRAEGWAVVDSKSGYHLPQSLAGPLFGDEPWCQPSLVVVDAFSPDCSGLSIAKGLRDLGRQVATVLIASGTAHSTNDERDLDGVYVVDRRLALQTVLEVARGWQQLRDDRLSFAPDSDCDNADADGEFEHTLTRSSSYDDRHMA